MTMEALSSASLLASKRENGHVNGNTKAPSSPENLSAVLHGPADIRMESRPCPAPGPGEVVVKIVATGLCGSDLHYYLHGRNGDFAMEHPMCLGHESSGHIVGVGAGVADAFPHLSIGARVAVEPGLNCAACERCLEGRYNLCEKMRFASSAKTSPHLDGTLQRYFTWPARLVHALPTSVSYRAAALLEPLAVVLQALSRADLRGGQSVLVFGAGAVGLLACAAAKAFGASYVAAVDIDEGRLSFAKTNQWADATLLLERGPAPGGAATQSTAQEDRKTQDQAQMKQFQTQARGILDHFVSASTPSKTAAGAASAAAAAAGNPLRSGFDLVLECTGVPSCVSMSIFTARPGAKVTLVGMGHPIQTMPLGAAALREVDILGVFRYANMFPRAIRLLSGGALRADGGGLRADGAQSSAEGKEGDQRGGIENIVSHTFRLQEAQAAFEALKTGRGQDGRGVVKVFIEDDESIQAPVR